jgi:hypothetical protein
VLLPDQKKRHERGFSAVSLSQYKLPVQFLGTIGAVGFAGTKLSSSLGNSVTWIRRLLRKAVREMSTRIGSDLIFFSEMR